MAKRKTEEPLELNEDQLEKKSSFHAISLLIGRWTEMYTDEQVKIIIAESLNFCTAYHYMKIAGYIITEKRLCLVLEIHSHETNGMLAKFYESVLKEIKKLRQQNDNADFKTASNEAIIKTVNFFTNLFIQQPLTDSYLVPLITGKPVYLSYYNPQLEKLKKYIHNCNFCSALDYSGAEGPVVVKLLHTEMGVRLK